MESSSSHTEQNSYSEAKSKDCARPRNEQPPNFKPQIDSPHLAKSSLNLPFFQSGANFDLRDIEGICTEPGTESTSTSATSPADSICHRSEHCATSISSTDIDNDRANGKANETHPACTGGAPTKAQYNHDTVSRFKKTMASNSRLIETFTVLRSTYLKLCKEFNYLLGKFNENERIKIELINENNKLREMLWETVRDKELDRKRYKAEIQALRSGG